MMFLPYISKFGDKVERVYPIELEIKDTTNTDTSVSFLDLHLDIDMIVRWKQKRISKEVISSSQLWTFSFYVATYKKRMHTKYNVNSRFLELSWFEIWDDSKYSRCSEFYSI